MVALAMYAISWSPSGSTLDAESVLGHVQLAACGVPAFAKQTSASQPQLELQPSVDR